VFTVDNECSEQERDFEVLAAFVFGGMMFCVSTRGLGVTFQKVCYQEVRV
jgi:hypothetical protein